MYLWSAMLGKTIAMKNHFSFRSLHARRWNTLCIEVPNASIDGTLLEGLHGTTFVNYLRICFRWGGFPEFENYRRDNEIYLQHFHSLKSKKAIPNKSFWKKT
jgi:hypothetical protein